MPPTRERADVAAWDVASPRRPSRTAGVTMAGFGVRKLTALRIVPPPAVILAVDFGAGRPLVDEASGHRHRGSLLAGPGFGFGGSVLVSGKDIACLQVRLSPVIAQAVLGVSPADLRGITVSLDDLWGADAFRIRERLSELDSWEERFALTDAFLADRRAGRSTVDREVAWAWRRMNASRGLVRIDALADELGWSRKRLWSRFGAQIGLPPKRAARLIRFDHAAHRLVAGQDAARVAADSGYVDQSHLHRDVMAYAGVTPSSVAGEPFLAIDGRAWPASTADVSPRVRGG